MPSIATNRRFSLPLAVLLSALVACLSACGSHPAANVSTTHAARRDLSAWISSNGKVEPVEPHIIQSRLTTFVENISVKQGEVTKPGEILLTLDAKDLNTELAHTRDDLVAAEDDAKVAAGGGDADAVAELQNNLAKTDAEILRLRNDRDSMERLYAKQAATRQEVNDAATPLAKAEADKRLYQEKLSQIQQRADVQGQRARLRIEGSHSAINSFEEKLKSATVRAPASGTIYSLPVHPGMYVHEGDVLAEIADLSRTRVRIYVDEPDLGSLQTGQSVEFTWDGLPNHVWKGRLDQLPDTIVTRGARNVGEVLCSLVDNDATLLPNTNVTARIRIAERSNSLAVPRSAVRTEDKKHFVYVVDHGRLRKQEVAIGISNATDYEVLSGITESDVIALPGGDELRDGMDVTIS